MRTYRERRKSPWLKPTVEIPDLFVSDPDALLQAAKGGDGIIQGSAIMRRLLQPENRVSRRGRREESSKRRFRVQWFLLAAALSSLDAQEPSAAAPPNQALSLRVWKVFPGLIPESLTAPASGGADQRDAREFFESIGIPFPEGSYARYFPGSKKVIFCNTAKNIALTEEALRGWVPERHQVLAASDGGMG